MKRSPMKRSTTPMKRTPMKRTATPLRRSAAARTAPKADPVTPEIRALVLRRSGGYCEARAVRECSGTAQHIHHRKLRRFGDHRPVNLLHVCQVCHTAIHARPADSYAAGFLVRGTADPADVPVASRPG